MRTNEFLVSKLQLMCTGVCLTRVPHASLSNLCMYMLLMLSFVFMQPALPQNRLRLPLVTTIILVGISMDVAMSIAEPS